MAPLSSLIQWNLASYRSKFAELKLLLRDFSPSCVCLQETLLRDLPGIPPSHYSLVQSRVTRPDGHERGAAILVHKSFNFQHFPLNTTLQAVAVTLRLSKAYTICSLYLPHVPVSYQELHNLIQQLPRPFVLMGDFNARSPDWGDACTNGKGRLVERLLADPGISLLTSGVPTHYHQQTNTSSVIDLTLCSSDCFLDFTYSVDSSLHDSDHFPVHLSLINPTDIHCRPCTLNMSKADWPLFSRLSKVLANSVPEADDIDVYLHHLCKHLLDAANASIPRRTGTLPRPPVPWWTPECDDMKRERTRAERAWHRSRTVANRIRYHRARAQCRFLFAERRRISWISYLSSINCRTSLSSVWRKLRVLSGKRVLTPAPSLRAADGSIVSDNAAVANMLARHFASVGEAALHADPRAAQLRRTEERVPVPMEGVGGSYNDAFSAAELAVALKSTADTSPGADSITYRMLKNADSSFRALLLAFYNRIYVSRVFPADWCLSIILPFAKPNKDPTLTDSYRPIALTSCLCKLMEKLINARLIWYLEAHNLISPIQFGFRAYRSTTDPLVLFETLARTAVASGRHLLAIFFDLTKAYDTAWGHRIVRVLRSYGVVGHLLHFIFNFLSNRSIMVRINATLSDVLPVRVGIPQGSVLSCTCFLLAINDIGDALPPSIHQSLYVDDFALVAVGARADTISRRLQLALSHLERWSRRSGFRFSAEKTVAMHICRVRGCPKLSHDLTLYGTVIPPVEVFKYLGMTIDNSLTWRPHINLLKQRCRRCLDVLKFISHSRYGADRKSLLRLYIGLVKPKLDYGCEAYGSSCASLLASLEPVQNCALRIATGAFRSSPILSLYAETGIKPLETYRHIKMLNYYVRLLVNPDPYVLAQLRTIVHGHFLADNNKARPFLLRVEELARLYEISFDRILPEAPFQLAPWCPLRLAVCTDLMDLRKSSTVESELSSRFHEHLTDHAGANILYTDGSKSAAAAGLAVVGENHTVKRRLLPAASIYTCELYAIFAAVTLSTERPDGRGVVIASDSKSALQALSSASNRHPLCTSIRKCISDSGANFRLCWVPSHVGIHGNERADAAAKQATALDRITRWPLPASDFRILIKTTATELWSQQWHQVEHNKLRSIKDSVRPHGSSFHRSREWEVKLSRLRLGHTQATHAFLMSGGALPYCDDCIVPLSVVHVLLECPSLCDDRTRLFGHLPQPLTLRSLLGDSGPVEHGGHLYTFLRAVNFYHVI